MVVNPAIIFLDEPTTGLDSYLAHQVVKLLRQLSKQGITVICTLHQPSSDLIQMFDNLLLLRLGFSNICMILISMIWLLEQIFKIIQSKGFHIFNGSLPNAKDFFASQGLPVELNFNPADHFIWQTSVNVDSPEESIQKIEVR